MAHNENSNSCDQRSRSGLGIAALILGIVGILIAWIPFLGLLTIPLAGLGSLLGLIGLILSLSNNETGIGLPISGVAVCALSILIAVICTAGTVGDITGFVSDALSAPYNITKPAAPDAHASPGELLPESANNVKRTKLSTDSTLDESIDTDHISNIENVASAQYENGVVLTVFKFDKPTDAVQAIRDVPKPESHQSWKRVTAGDHSFLHYRADHYTFMWATKQWVFLVTGDIKAEVEKVLLGTDYATEKEE